MGQIYTLRRPRWLTTTPCWFWSPRTALDHRPPTLISPPHVACTQNSSKYSKKDVFELKAVFDEYDKDRSGRISVDEFSSSLKAKKAASAPRPGEKSTLAQRKAQEGVSIIDLSEGIFTEVQEGAPLNS